ncbi:MAG: LLM class flavin-dependent oxidoreductase [Acidimicrobiales bacterium]
MPDPALASSWDHCRSIVVAADRNGFDAVLLPSGYALGVGATAFAAAVAPLTERIRLLLAVRIGELVVPQLARQIATLQQILGDRLLVNIISSDVPGESLASEPRYQRTLTAMRDLRRLLAGEAVSVHGEALAAPRIAAAGPGCPPLYFGGLSPAARDVAAQEADVYLMWPDTLPAVAAIVDDLRTRAAAHGRTLRFGYRVHVIVRESEAEARAAARHLVAALDDDTGTAIRNRSLDTASAGVARQGELRHAADDEGYVEDNLWTGIGRARSGAGAAIVGDPDQVRAKLDAYRQLGIDAFILSGYPHERECDRVARLVLDGYPHAPLGA